MSDVSYPTYLELDALLDLQRPRSTPPHPDELLFIVVHQASELWFKVILHELDALIAQLEAGEVTGALTAVKRVNALVGIVAGAMLAFVTALGEFVASILLYTQRTRPISIEILAQLRAFDFGAAAVEGQPDWREASFQLNHRLTEASAVTGRIEAARRFDLNDVYGELRVDHRFSPDFSVWLAAGGTPEADFRPSWQLGAGLAARVRGGPQATVLTFDLVQAHYRSGDIQTVTPGVEQYFANGKAWATARWINIIGDGDHRSGWLARGDVMAGSRVRLFAGLADAPDLSEGIIVDTFSVFGGLVADVGDRTTFRFSVARDDRAVGDRLSGSIGLGWRF